jgi:hypothetical protein
LVTEVSLYYDAWSEKHQFKNEVCCHILEDNCDTGDVRSIVHKNGEENKKNNTMKNHKSMLNEIL